MCTGALNTVVTGGGAIIGDQTANPLTAEHTHACVHRWFTLVHVHVPTRAL